VSRVRGKRTSGHSKKRARDRLSREKQKKGQPKKKVLPNELNWGTTILGRYEGGGPKENNKKQRTGQRVALRGVKNRRWATKSRTRKMKNK